MNDVISQLASKDNTSTKFCDYWCRQ